MESEESTEEIIRKVIYYLVDYESKTGHYPAVIEFPELHNWITILSNRKVNWWLLDRAITNLITDKYDAEEIIQKISNARYILREFDPTDIDYIVASIELEILENQLRQLTSISEQAIDKAVMGHHGPARLIGAMIGLNEYKHESGSIELERFEQQLLNNIPDMVSRGIRYNAFLNGADWNASELYRFIQHRPESVSRVRLAFEREEYERISDLILYIEQSYEDRMDFITNAQYDSLFQELYRRAAHLPDTDKGIRQFFSFECSSGICPICYEEMSYGQVSMKLLPCKHCFHSDCITRWFQFQFSQGQNEEKCPYCNTAVENNKTSRITS